MTAKPGEWIASWRLTRRQLEAVARGELPAIWRTWAIRDLKVLGDPATCYVSRVGSVRATRKKT
jgi:hypothetical protein